MLLKQLYKIIKTASFVVCGLFLLLFVQSSALAWVGPTGDAPSNNVAPPLNQGTVFMGDVNGTYSSLKIKPASCSAAGTVLGWNGTSVVCTSTSSGIGGVSGTADYIPKFTGANSLGNSNIYNLASGKVGINTSDISLQATVEIKNQPSGTSRLRISDLTNNPELQFQYGSISDNTHWSLFVNQPDDSFNIWGTTNGLASGGGNYVTILNNGNMGIGKSPATKLDVNGDIAANTVRGQVANTSFPAIWGNATADNTKAIQGSASGVNSWAGWFNGVNGVYISRLCLGNTAAGSCLTAWPTGGSSGSGGVNYGGAGQIAYYKSAGSNVTGTSALIVDAQNTVTASNKLAASYVVANLASSASSNRAISGLSNTVDNTTAVYGLVTGANSWAGEFTGGKGVYASALRVDGNTQVNGKVSSRGLRSVYSSVQLADPAVYGGNFVNNPSTAFVVGVLGEASAGNSATSFTVGVYGNATSSNAIGVYGKSNSYRGVWGDTDSGYSGYFTGGKGIQVVGDIAASGFVAGGSVGDFGSANTYNDAVRSRNNSSVVNSEAGVSFVMRNSGGVSKYYADIRGGIESNTANAEKGYLNFYTYTGATANPAMRITSGGNVGIGTTNPYGVLTVASNAADGGGSAAKGITFVDTLNSVSNPWTHAAIYTSGSSGYNGDLIFATDGDGVNNNNPTEKMRIQSNGNVGIGVAPSSGVRLALGGPTTPGLPDLQLNNTAKANSYDGVIMQYYSSKSGADWITGTGRSDVFTSDTNFGFYHNSGNSVGTKMVITETGSVGIGTTAPAQKLDVVGNVIASSFVATGPTSGIKPVVGLPCVSGGGPGTITYALDSSNNGHFYGCVGNNVGGTVWKQLDN